MMPLPLTSLFCRGAFLLAAGANPLVLDEANELRSGLYMVLLQQGTQRQLLRLVRE